MKSLNQLKIAEAYIEGHIDVEGDLIKALMFQNVLSDKNTWLKVWRRIKPLEVVKQSSEQLWRIFRILFAGTASRMNIPSHYATAYRVVLEYPADFVHGME